MQEAWEYIKEENFQMKGPEKEERKRIRTRTIEKKRRERNVHILVQEFVLMPA